jgi:hypothetical protein
VPAVSWGQRISGFGHAIKDAALGTANPALWDIVDAGDAASPSAATSNSPSGTSQTPDAQGSLQDSGSKSQLASGLKTATAASPAAAAEALNEAFTHAQQLIDKALTAVLDQRMPGPAEEGFKQALAAFLQAETHLRDWGLAMLNPAQAANHKPSTVVAPTGSGDSAEHLRQSGVDQLRVVVQQLQVLLPQEAGSGHAATGDAQTAFTTCMATTPRGTAAASSGPHSPADDILASLTCLEQLTSGLSAAGDGSDAATAAAAGAGGSAAAAAGGAASDKDAGKGALGSDECCFHGNVCEFLQRTSAALAGGC